MKIAIICDSHYGKGNDSKIYLDNAKDFTSKVFFPYLESNGIDTIIHMGDLMDRRKYVNYNTLSRVREDFLEKLHPYKMYITAGNHDVYHKNVNSTNALKELVSHYSNITVFDTNAGEVILDGTKILFVPWICAENREDTIAKIRDTDAQICIGHLEIQGFEMYRGSVAIHGDNQDIFSKFDITMSGHFHHKSTNGSIFYLGTACQLTWSDYGENKGFHIFDTETRDLEFISNPYTLYEKIEYDENEIISNFEKYRNKFVKVLVKNKTNQYVFDNFISELDKFELNSLQIIEESTELSNEEEFTSETESTIDIFKKYIETSISGVDKFKLEQVVISLYNEAIAAKGEK